MKSVISRAKWSRTNFETIGIQFLELSGNCRDFFWATVGPDSYNYRDF